MWKWLIINRKIDVKNLTCHYLVNVNKISDVDFENIVLHEKIFSWWQYY